MLPVEAATLAPRRDVPVGLFTVVAVVHSGEEAMSRGAASLAEDTCASTAATADEALKSLGEASLRRRGRQPAGWLFSMEHRTG